MTPLRQMPDQEYEDIQNLLLAQAKLISMLDLDSFLERARYADEVGPFLDPTASIAGGETLRAIIGLAVAFREVQRTHLALMELLEKKRASR